MYVDQVIYSIYSVCPWHVWSTFNFQIPKYFLWFCNTRHTLNCSKQKHTSQVTKDWKNFFLHSLTPNKLLGCFNVNFKKSHNLYLYFILTGLSSIKNCERTFETKLAMTEMATNQTPEAPKKGEPLRSHPPSSPALIRFCKLDRLALVDWETRLVIITEYS